MKVVIWSVIILIHQKALGSLLNPPVKNETKLQFQFSAHVVTHLRRRKKERFSLHLWLSRLECLKASIFNFHSRFTVEKKKKKKTSSFKQNKSIYSCWKETPVFNAHSFSQGRTQQQKIRAKNRVKVFSLSYFRSLKGKKRKTNCPN